MLKRSRQRGPTPSSAPRKIVVSLTHANKKTHPLVQKMGPSARAHLAAYARNKKISSLRPEKPSPFDK